VAIRVLIFGATGLVGQAVLRECLLVHSVVPNYVLTTEEVGKAMLIVAKRRYSQDILETKDIRAVVSA